MSGPLRLEEVSVALEGRVLIPPLSVRVMPGEVLTLMGPSGAGKSALLSFLGGTVSAAFRVAGRIWIGEREVTGLPSERRRIGILFQDDLLFPHLSVGENLAFGLSPSVRGRQARAARIEAALGEAGLAGFSRRDPATLSGGQRARVAMLRLLLAEPQVLLLDEPFNKLDAAMRAEFRRFVFEHARAAGLPVLMVTHDAADAAAAQGGVLELSQTPDGAAVITRAPGALTLLDNPDDKLSEPAGSPLAHEVIS